MRIAVLKAADAEFAVETAVNYRTVRLPMDKMDLKNRETKIAHIPPKKPTHNL